MLEHHCFRHEEPLGVSSQRRQQDVSEVTEDACRGHSDGACLRVLVRDLLQ